MSKNKGQLTELWNDARVLLKEGKLEEATDKLDMGILHLAAHTLRGVGDKELIEGVKKETWYERFWIAIQTHIWPTYPDYEENWRDTSGRL